MVVTISDLAERSGVSPGTLRYYERRGLLEPAGRTAGGYRLYEPDALERLRFIKNAQRIGLRLDDVKGLLEVLDRGTCPCGHAAALIERRLAEVDAEMSRLRATRHQLIAVGRRSQACADADGADGATWSCSSDVSERR
jgi:DNA-binding transcriptional MerR regulator